MTTMADKPTSPKSRRMKGPRKEKDAEAEELSMKEKCSQAILGQRVAEADAKKAKDRVKELAMRMGEMNKEMAAAQRSVLSLREQVEELKREQLKKGTEKEKDLKGRLNETNRELAAVQKEMLETKKRLDDRDSKIKKLKEQLRTQQEQIKAQDAHGGSDEGSQCSITDIPDESELTELGSPSHVGHGAMDSKLMSELTSLRSRMAEIEDAQHANDTKDVCAAAEALGELIDADGSEREKSLLAQVTKQQEETASLRSELSASKAAIRALEENADIQDSLLSDLVASGGDELSEARAEADASRKKVTELEIALRLAQAQAVGGGGGGGDAEGMEMLEAELEVLREELENTIEEKEAFCEAAADEVAELRMELEVTQEELMNAQSGAGDVASTEEMDVMTESLAEERVRAEALEEQLAENAASLAESEARFALEREALQAELEQTRQAAAADAAQREADAAAALAEATAAASSKIDTETLRAISKGHAALRAECSKMREDSARAMGQTMSMALETMGGAMQQMVRDADARVARGAEEARQNATQAASEALSEMKQLYTLECKQRKKLYNELQDLRGNLRVYCRTRPLTKEEAATQGDHETIVMDKDAGAMTVVEKDGRKGIGKRRFECDEVYGCGATQEEVFEDCAPLITSILDGYNVCIFAYGQSGSGKTHTMNGYAGDPGISMRATARLFEQIAERSELEDFSVSMSMMEIYLDDIVDLLSPTKQPLKLSQEKDGSVCVQGLTVVNVADTDAVDHTAELGFKHRSIGKTNLNQHSSRSHLIVKLDVTTTNKTSGATSVGKLSLVDLAGSERVGKSGADGDRLKEAQAINKSLSALGDVVRTLAKGGSHIPYRNSKLTHLLSDSIGGDSKTLMYCMVSPRDLDAQETLCSLNFAANAKEVVSGPATKHMKSPTPPTSPDPNRSKTVSTKRR